MIAGIFALVGFIGVVLTLWDIYARYKNWRKS